MGVMTLKKFTTHMVRCDLCHNPTHYTYHFQFDGVNYKFCSGAHADQARKNFEDKKAKGITPTQPTPVDELTEDDAEGANIYE